MYQNAHGTVLSGLFGLFCFALVPSPLLAARSSGGQCVDRGLHLTFPGALSGKESHSFLCFPGLPLAVCQHGSQSEGCSVAATETHGQGVVGVCEAVNLSDVVVPVFNSQQHEHSAGSLLI